MGGIRAIRDTTISNRNTTYAKLAGIKKIRIHDFRHSNASLLINIRILARRLGDTKNKIMRTYSHLYPKEEEKVIDILNKIKI
jgi:integrase